MTADVLAKGRALRDAEQGGPYQRRTTYAFSDWLDQHCDELLDSAALAPELVETLLDVLSQACGGTDVDRDRLDSLALTAYADGLRLLATLGRVTIEAEHGRRVIARLRPTEGATS